MSTGKSLAAYYGDEKLYFVQSTEGTQSKNFSVFLKKGKTGLTEGHKYIPSGSHLNTALIEAFKENKISANKINLSLPTREIIFRSFVIPWMPNSELRNVIKTEIGKYIPFTLDTLSYAFNTLSFTKAGIKHIRVVFIAIKKDILEKYSECLEQLALKVSVVEPSALSLIRLLNFKGLLTNQQTLAIIEKSKNSGKIIIVNEGIPLFVREFQIKVIRADGENPSKKDLQQKLNGEIRISLDYFNRQDSSVQVNEIYFISSNSDKTISDDISQDIGLPIKHIDINDLFESGDSIEHIYSYGMSLINADSSDITFNLSTHVEEKPKTIARKTLIADYKSAIITSLICVPVIIATFFISHNINAKSQNKMSNLVKKLGIFSDAPLESIKKQNADLNTKLENYKKIRINSHSAYFLALIPELLPKGTWINDFDLRYVDVPVTQKKGKKKQIKPQKSRLKLNLSGYAYQKNTKEQFKLIDEFTDNLKKDKRIGHFFKLIDLETYKVDKINDFKVTYFKIKCE